MKLIQYYDDKNVIRLGVETENGVFDVISEASRNGIDAPATMMLLPQCLN